MNKRGDGLIELLIILSALLFVSPYICRELKATGYREGQIDYAQGKIKYHQVTLNEWVEKDEN